MSKNRSQQKGSRLMKQVVTYLQDVCDFDGFAKERKVLCGDVHVPDWFPYIVEVKNGYGWRWEHIINNTGKLTCKIAEFWKQVCRDSKLDKDKARCGRRIPMLIFKERNTPMMIMLPKHSNAYNAEPLDDDGICFIAADSVCGQVICFPAPKPEIMRKILKRRKK